MGMISNSRYRMPVYWERLCGKKAKIYELVEKGNPCCVSGRFNTLFRLTDE